MKTRLKSIILLIFGGFLAACTGSQNQAAPATLAATRTQPVVFTRTETLWPTPALSTRTSPPSPSATPTKPLTSNGREPITIIHLRMDDPQNGWAVDDRFRVLKTHDGGQTWMDAAPGKQAEFSYASFASVDNDHAWFMESHFMQEARCELSRDIQELSACYTTWVLWKTDDGGKTWIPIKVEEGKGNEPHPTRMFFVDRFFGWSMVYLVDAPMGHGAYQISISANGGATWLPTRASFSEIESICVDKGERIWFTDLRSGWRSGSCEPYIVSGKDTTFLGYGYETTIDDFIARHSILLDHSADGGLTWSLQSIAAPNDLQDEMIRQKQQGFDGYVSHAIGRINTYGPHNFGFFVAFAASPTSLKPNFDRPVDPIYPYLYLSFNSGQTYRILPMPREVVETGSVYFLDQETGWRWGAIADGTSYVERTADGGKNWESMADHLNWIGDLHFVDENHGWAITNYEKVKTESWGGWQWASTNTHADTELLRTSDGGRTWERISPELITP